MGFGLSTLKNVAKRNWDDPVTVLRSTRDGTLDEDVKARWDEDREWHGLKGDGGSSGDAAERMARITRDMWTDWKKNVLPKERQLMEMGMGDADNKLSEELARKSIDNSFAKSERAENQSLRSLGLSLSPEEKAYRDKSRQREKMGATVDNVNNARLHARDRDNMILSGDTIGSLRDTEQYGA